MDDEMTAAQSADSDLAARFADVSRYLLSAATTTELLLRIVELAVETVDGCDYAGIMLPTPDRPGTAVQTAPIVSDIDQHQLTTGEGPCLDALRGRNCVYAHDLAEHGQSWPRFAPRCVTHGIRSVLAYRLFNGTGTHGALNLYATLPAAYGATARAVASVYAAHAGTAVAVAHSRDADIHRTEHLRQALTSRETIGQAQGILMERERITADQAFHVLRRASQHLNIKLREIAQDVIDTGALPQDQRNQHHHKQPRRPG